MLDTNICSFLSRKPSETLKNHLLKADPNNIFISSIVLAEIKYGVRNNPKYQYVLDGFLSTVNVVDFDSEAASHYADIRYQLKTRGNIIGANDLLIAAHARSLEAVLVTNNTKEFQRVPDLNIEDWTQ